MRMVALFGKVTLPLITFAFLNSNDVPTLVPSFEIMTPTQVSRFPEVLVTVAKPTQT